jgi:MraZ protein
MLYSTAVETELDSAGRVMLTPKFLAHAGIDREVVITGVGECLELWDHSSWEAYDTDLTARAPDLTESLGHPA